MRNLLEHRVLFFGGKGGVGKTTCASALALAASRAGKNVLLVSTDPAHSTSDIFEQPVSREERAILPSLTTLEIDAEFEARRYVRDVKDRIASLFSPGVANEAVKQIDLVAGMPGLADVALFDRITELVLGRFGAYDLIVFDTAPTGHTLRLLHMPDSMAAWVHALAERRRASQNVARQSGSPDVRESESRTAFRPGLRSNDRGVGASDEGREDDPVLATLTARQAKLASVRDLLTRYETTAFVLVLIPERLPIEESARAVHELEHAHLHVGAAIVNRILPEGLSGEYYASRKAQERRYLEEIDHRFRAIPRMQVPQLESDVHGLSALARIADFLVR